MLKRTANTAVLVTPLARQLPAWKDCDWIGVDAGWQVIEACGKPLCAAIGDFDTGPAPQSGVPVLRFPVHKDETDSELAMKTAVEAGYEHVILFGGLSGRLDHTLANLRCMAWKYPQVVCMDEQQKVSVLLPGWHVLHSDYLHVSFFALEVCRLSLIGFEYPLSRQPLDSHDFYTVSNVMAEEEAKVYNELGRILCVESRQR